MEKTCDVCFTSSFEPTPDEAECALVHPHDGVHERCGYCRQDAWILDLAGEVEMLRAFVEEMRRFQAGLKRSGVAFDQLDKALANVPARREE